MELFTETSKTFKTRETAVARATLVMDRLDLPETRYVIATSAEGRFFPVFILSGSEQRRAMDFVTAGYCVAG